MPERLPNIDFFERVGLRNLSETEISQALRNYMTALEDGLAGRKSDLPMYNSLLSATPLETLREGSQALILEIGGTNLYGARVGIDGGKPRIIESHKDALPGRQYRSADEFFAYVANGIAPIVSEGKFDAIGIVYSFPGETIETGTGDVDIQSPEHLTKEFVIPGISQAPVGEALKATLQQNYGIDLATPTVVLNDTVAVVFSDGAKLGGVVGTGFNLAADTPLGITNTESGAFSQIPVNQFAELVDRRSNNNRGQYLAEKQISGLWLGEQMRLIVDELSHEGIPGLPTDISAETITQHLSGFEGNPMVTEAATRLRDRSAQIVGIMTAGIIKTFPTVFESEVIRVPIEGSLFWKVPGYKELASEVAKSLSGKNIHFVNIEEAGRIGAAVAALGNANKR
ncbi:MAG TPA: hypothetical protein VG917_02205 [Patescibacteria group bacterium]|nr:hypothetical protein [Patescibacteria group bacterium]